MFPTKKDSGLAVIVAKGSSVNNMYSWCLGLKDGTQPFCPTKISRY